MTYNYSKITLSPTRNINQNKSLIIYNEQSDRDSRQLDLDAAASGYGYCPDGIPVEVAICGVLAAFAVAFGVLYRAVTLKTGGRRKRRDIAPENDIVKPQNKLADFVWAGENENYCCLTCGH